MLNVYQIYFHSAADKLLLECARHLFYRFPLKFHPKRFFHSSQELFQDGLLLISLLLLLLLLQLQVLTGIISKVEAFSDLSLIFATLCGHYFVECIQES